MATTDGGEGQAGERPPARSARLVLVARSGELLGALAPFPVITSWWPDAEPVVRGARDHHGVEVTVLRLLWERL